MINKYSGLSDFEVNKLIADSLGYEYEIGFYYPDPAPVNPIDYNYINKKVTNNKKFWVHIDYCKHYKDALKLMIDNGISLISHTKNHQGVVVYSALSDFIECTYHVDNENPCRAIAECYLLMKVAENNNDK